MFYRSRGEFFIVNASINRTLSSKYHVPADIVVLNSYAVGNNFEIENYFTKYLKESRFCAD